MRHGLSCLMIWACLGGAAAAERAPIVYAGQGAPTAAAGPAQTGPVQLIASADARLTGGSDTSYGYGARAERGGAVIDIRRTPPSNSQSTTPAWRAEPPVEPVAIAAQAPAPQPAPPTQPEQGQQPWLERERVGPPYQAEGRWYVPTPEPGYAQTGLASWYGPDFHGRATATGETYDQHALTAAHPTLPLNSLVQVTNLENGREVIVRINDRGPFVGERLIDMSRAGAQVLGFEQTGTARVHVRYLGPAPRRVNAEGAPAPAPVAAAQVDGPTQLWPSAPEAEAAPQPAWNAPTVQQTSHAPAPRVPANGAFMVQVGAFSDPANAQRVRATVESEGPVEVDVRHSASGAELFRVRLGPFSSREEADAARRSLVGMGYPEAVVAQR